MTMIIRSTGRCLDRLTAALSGRRPLFSRLTVERVCNLTPIANCTTNSSPKLDGKPVSLTFNTADGSTITAKGSEGDTILDIVRNNNLDIEGYGVCDGGLACSTCHVILTPEDYKMLGGHPAEEEADVLDMAGHRSHTSRLGCQVQVTKKMDGIILRIPELIRDARGTD